MATPAKLWHNTYISLFDLEKGAWLPIHNTHINGSCRTVHLKGPMEEWLGSQIVGFWDLSPLRLFSMPSLPTLDFMCQNLQVHPQKNWSWLPMVRQDRLANFEFSLVKNTLHVTDRFSIKGFIWLLLVWVFLKLLVKRGVKSYWLVHICILKTIFYFTE